MMPAQFPAGAIAARCCADPMPAPLDQCLMLLQMHLPTTALPTTAHLAPLHGDTGRMHNWQVSAGVVLP